MLTRDASCGASAMRRQCPSPRFVVRALVVVIVVRLLVVTYDWLVDVEPSGASVDVIVIIRFICSVTETHDVIDAGDPVT